MLRGTARISLLTLVAIAALAAAFVFSAPIEAQHETYVDLSVEVVATTSWKFTARNNGTADAYGVTVDIEMADQVFGSYLGEIELSSGTTCSGDIPGATCINGVWTVGFLGAGQEKQAFIVTKLAPGLPCCSNISTRWTVPTRAEIGNTAPGEEERFRGNNSAVGWIFVSQDRGNTEAAGGQYWLDASVDNLLPEAGDTVKFSFDVDAGPRPRRHVGSAKVRLKLDNGLGTPRATSLPAGETFARAPGLDRTWDWNIGVINVANMEVSTTLDDPLPAGVDRSDLCLTAELTARPDYVPATDRFTSTSAEICLREDPVTLLRAGETDLFTVYPCVGVATYPCSSSDTLELLANGGYAAGAAGIGRDDAILDPANVVIQVRDPEGRHATGGWRTGGDGVVHNINLSLLDASNWTHMKRSITVPSGVTLPGSLSIRPKVNLNFNFLDPVNATSAGPFAFNSTFNLEQVVIFGALGTYRVTPAFEFTHATIDADNDGSKDKFAGSGTYTFHVGPVADLEVRDGGGSPHATSSQRAFTIEAINNGPDNTEGAAVTVTLPSGVNILQAIPSAGSYDQSSGVWTLEGAALNEHRQGLPQALTLVTDATSQVEATATIANTEPYRVVIDGTPHQGTVFDYLDSNSRDVPIKARPGTRGTSPETRPGMVGAVPMGSANLVFWTDSESGASHEDFGRRQSWDIEYNSSDWSPLTYRYRAFGGFRFYIDREVPDGESRTYRVRARYADRVGDWTEQGQAAEAGGATGQSGTPGVSVDPTAMFLREGGSSSYRVRLEAQPSDDVIISLRKGNSDVRLSTDTLTFTPSNWSRRQTVNVTIAHDLDTADETDTITHSIALDSAAYEYDAVSIDSVGITIDDDETAPRLTAGGLARTEIGVDEGGSTTYQLVLGTRPAEDITVDLFYPGGMIMVSPDRVVFTPENWNRPQTVTVTGVHDDDVVDDEGAFICHRYSGGFAEEQCLSVVVSDDDRAAGGEVELSLSGYCPGQWPESLTGATITVTGYPEGGGGCYYALRLNAAPAGNLTVTVRPSNGKVTVDTTRSQPFGEETPGRLVFTPANWSSPQEIGFWPEWDPDAADETVTISHRISGGGGVYNGVSIPDIRLMIEDWDEEGIRVDVNGGTLEAHEGDARTDPGDLWSATYYVYPETRPTGNVTISMSSDNPDVTVSPSRLVFRPSAWHAEQGYTGDAIGRVTVRAREDDDAEDETATITLTVSSSDPGYNGIEAGTVSVRVVDNDKEQ